LYQFVNLSISTSRILFNQSNKASPNQSIPLHITLLHHHHPPLLISNILNGRHYTPHLNSFGPGLEVHHNNDTTVSVLCRGSESDLEVHARDDLFLDGEDVAQGAAGLHQVEGSGDLLDLLEWAGFLQLLELGSLGHVVGAGDLRLGGKITLPSYLRLDLGWGWAKATMAISVMMRICLVIRDF